MTYTRISCVHDVLSHPQQFISSLHAVSNHWDRNASHVSKANMTTPIPAGYYFIRSVSDSPLPLSAVGIEFNTLIPTQNIGAQGWYIEPTGVFYDAPQYKIHDTANSLILSVNGNGVVNLQAASTARWTIQPRQGGYIIGPATYPPDDRALSVASTKQYAELTQRSGQPQQLWLLDRYSEGAPPPVAVDLASKQIDVVTHGMSQLTTSTSSPI